MERPIYQVFLVLHPVTSRLGELAYALEPLVTGDPQVADIDLFHREAADTALVALHYDERDLSGDALRRLDDVARGSGLTIVDPARMSTEERRVFFDSRLGQFELCARGLGSVAEVVAVLGERLGVHAPPMARATPRDGVARLRGESPRLVVTVPPLPALHARHDSPPARPPTLPPAPDHSRATRVGKVTERNETVTDRLALALAEQAKRARRAAEATLRAPRPPTAPTADDDHTAPVPSPVPTPIPRWADAEVAAPEEEIHVLETARLQPLAPATRACGAHPRIGSDPGMLEVAPHLDVRFLRGGDWVPVRARALSARGAYIVTSAPARLGDTVHVSVSCSGRTALVRGTVYHVTTADDALSTGASGFAVRFPEYACPARTHLIQVLLAARQAGVTLRPPPNRTSVRFPVRWPVQLASAAGQFHADAQDVSSDGLFIATPLALELGTELRFAVPLDLSDVPIEGRARVARIQHVDNTEQRGMAHGFGTRIVSMSEPDRVRWDAFLGRVRRRTEKRILVGAAPGRVEEIAAGLFAAGYTVTSGSDLGLLMRVAELDPCPPDIAVIDADFDRSSAPSGWIEQVFAARQVPCVTIQGGDVREARSVVDRLLHVEA